MNEIFYKCTLLSDIVLNSSLATEGNIQSLDYITGSNFYGIVATSIYKNDNIDKEKKRLLHSDAVSFGDAVISDGQSPFYSMPYMYFKEKDNAEAKIHLHHLIVGKYEGTQFKQERNGYMNAEGKYFKKVKKNFQLKSAYDREKRTSDDGKMFGFEAINKGQTFVFSIIYQNENDINTIEKLLLGEKYIGKSKTAQYGKVKIEKAENLNPINSFEITDFALVYAESNLCFFDDKGMPTYRPTLAQLGFESGEIVWEKSQIRTYTYSPWNGHRATNTMQRNCIGKGSVFYIQNPQPQKGHLRQVGEYLNEGLGRILINPLFLENNGDLLKTELSEITIDNDNEKPKSQTNSILFSTLNRIKEEKQKEIEIAGQVNKTLTQLEKDKSSLLKISSSQWGAIRAYATKAEDLDKLYKDLFEEKKGYLTHGVADKRYWSKNRNLEKLKETMFAEDKKDLGSDFVVKLSAEIAKKVNNKDKHKPENNQ
ncbi:MAG: hypothetical protein MUE53_10065 [Chitinophagales bacterium]|jgi:hypothetical protein|nr:hypothetical protein [Chitinophagales bacterium]